VWPSSRSVQSRLSLAFRSKANKALGAPAQRLAAPSFLYTHFSSHEIPWLVLEHIAAPAAPASPRLRPLPHQAAQELAEPQTFLLCLKCLSSYSLQSCFLPLNDLPAPGPSHRQLGPEAASGFLSSGSQYPKHSRSIKSKSTDLQGLSPKDPLCSS
jgi:hypothetical protein